ncbi:MAG: DUF4340 domain-containing protein [Elusimicrobiota bacterium]
MNIKNLLIVLSLIILIYIAVLTLNQPKIYSNTPFSKKIDTNKITEITITNLTHEVSLSKKEKIWLMTKPYHYKADNQEIESLIEKISKAKLYGPLTDKKTEYYRFEIYPDSSTLVTLKSNKTLSLLIGKATQDYNGTFIKFKESDEIYELKGIYPFDFKKNSQDLLYKNIVESDISEINSYEIIYNKSKIYDSKSGDKWLKENSQRIIEKLKEIRFNKIEKVEKEKEKILAEITLKSQNNDERLSIYKKGKNYIIFKNDYELTIEDSYSKKIESFIDELKKDISTKK